MKKTVSKVFLVISFLPYMFMICYGLISAFFGFDLLTGSATCYGLKAFAFSIVMTFCILCGAFVIPLSVSYQTIYFIRYMLENRRASKEMMFLISASMLLLFIVLGAFVFCLI